MVRRLNMKRRTMAISFIFIFLLYLNPLNLVSVADEGEKWYKLSLIVYDAINKLLGKETELSRELDADYVRFKYLGDPEYALREDLKTRANAEDRKKNEVTSLNAKINDIEKEIKNIESAILQVIHEIERETDVDKKKQLEQKRDGMYVTIGSKGREVYDLKDKIKETENRYDRTIADLTTAIEGLKIKADEWKQIKSRIDELEAKRKQVKDEINQKKAELKTIEDKIAEEKAKKKE